MPLPCPPLPSFAMSIRDGEPALQAKFEGRMGTQCRQPSCTSAGAGYMFTYWNSKASKEREAQIDRVNAQVQVAKCQHAHEIHSCDARNAALATGMCGLHAGPHPNHGVANV